jgi:type II secretory pathway component PulJ
VFVRHTIFRRRRRRSGFTLAEVILAALFAAIACTAAAALIKSINDASATTSGIYGAAASARDGIACMDMLVEQAGLIGYRDDNRILIWRNDDNKDGQINLLELTLFRYSSATGSLDLVEIHFPPGTSSETIDQQNVVLTVSQAVAAGAASQVEQHANVCVRQLVNGITQFRAWSDGTGVPARMAQVTFTVTRDDGSQAFHTLMTPRSPDRGMTS